MKKFLESLYIKTIIIPIARDFHARIESAESMLNGTIDGLCNYEVAMESIRKDFLAMSERTQVLVGKVTKSMVS